MDRRKTPHGTKDRVSSLHLVKRAIVRAKLTAIRMKKLQEKTEIANFIMQELLPLRGRENDDAVWFAYVYGIIGNTRESRHDKDDEPQGVFDLDLPIPIKRYRLEAQLKDGWIAKQVGDKWIVVSPDGSEEPADPKAIPGYMSHATQHYDHTDMIEVRNFRVAEIDQRIRQIEQSMERDKASYERWVKASSLIRPLLVIHPTWTLGDAVSDLRDRGEWPEDLDHGEDW